MPVRRWLAHQLFAFLEEPLRAYLETQNVEHRLSALEREVAKLAAASTDEGVDKRLSIMMGAIQAAGTQIVQLRQDVERAGNLARQATQQATSAYAMAESAADGVLALETK